jgi:tRNA threonylcarbamoyladenosine biosynthesis protein TsaB
LRQLAIETATEACSVALFEDGKPIGHVHEVVGRGHAERLIPMVASLPERGRADRILVDCGPGSFTGVRVGLAAARALALAWGAEVTGYSSLSLLAARARSEHPELEALAVAIIGGHGEYFVQTFAGSPMRPMTPLVSLPPLKAARACAALPVFGSGADAILAAGAPGPGHALEADARMTVLLAPDLAALPPAPIYGRAPDARLPA